jgi:alpha/beta superfamily hydrolase
MTHLDAQIERARACGGSAGMLDNGRWELHFPDRAMVLYWVEDPHGDVQRFP